MNVLIGIDGSDDARYAVQFVRRLLSTLAVEDEAGHEVFLYHACRLPYVPSGDYDFISGETYMELREMITQRARTLLKEAAEVLGDSALRIRAHHDFAVPAQGMAELAKREGTDLIVVGTRGLTGLKRLALGSVSQRITELAPCSVLITRRPAQ